MKIQLNNTSGVPYYRQIINNIETMKASGKLLPGDKLPTIRALAIELKINPNTIAKAYNELEIKGVVTTQVGRGTFISDMDSEINDNVINREIIETVKNFLNDLKMFNVDYDDIPELIRQCQEDK
ncbi:MAG: GntR family transcriptional regulator [Spirochaetes bacterium]|nr:GntR family transcriptional regulator [Spirochaetota bacterium]MBN2769397.1 GntR family transcriptional regulator [Spirochaetota bacterium]